MSSFLDSTGLSRLVSKITDYFAKKDGSYPNMNVGTVNGYTVGKSVPSDAKFTDTTYPKAVKNITRSGTTFTATCYDGTTFTFTQQDNNTTYSAGSGLSLSGTTFSLKTGYTTSGKNYKVQLDSSGNPYVNVPWTDNNTTYSAGTGIGLSGTTFTNQGIRDCYWDSTNDKVYVDKGGKASRFTVGYASRAARMDNWRIYTAKQPCAALVTTTATSSGTCFWCARIVILETGAAHQVIDLICGSRGNNLLFTASKLHSAGSWTTKLYAVKNADYKYTFYIEVQNMKSSYISYHVTQYQSYGTVETLGTTSTSFSGSAASTITIT